MILLPEQFSSAQCHFIFDNLSNNVLSEVAKVKNNTLTQNNQYILLGLL